MTQGTVGGGCVRQITRPRGLAAPGRRGWGLGLVAAVLLGMSWVGTGHGAPGDLDPTFGAGGVAITFGPQDFANALALQPDGKLVVAGSSSGTRLLGAIFLARYQSDGQPDLTFGDGGKVATTIGDSQAAFALIRQPDGKLVVAGYAHTGGETGVPNAVLLVRYLPDGRLDAAFGNSGVVTTDFGANNNGIGMALALQPDSKIIVAGGVRAGPRFGYTILVRYLPDGRLDDTFGTGGRVTVSPVGTSNAASALLLQADGKLVVTGSGFTAVTPGTLFITRFQPDGSLDPTFGQAGTVTFVSPLQGAASSGQAIIQQSDGKLVVAGAFPTSGATGLLARYLPNGSLDPSFGTGGIAMPPIGSSGGGVGLIQQPDSKLVVAGGFSAGGTTGLMLARFQPDGRVDATFGLGGLVTTALGGQAFARALRQQPDGKLVVAGSLSTGGADDILLARYQALGCPAVDPDPCLASLAAFVIEVYQAAFARQPDAGEEAYWVDVLATEPTPDTVGGLLHVVFDGSEFRQRPVNPWQYVAALYQAILGRDPAPAELDWWVQGVLDRFDTVLPEFLDSPEFQRLVPSCQDQSAVTLLVGRLYQQVLRRVASAGELAWWTADVATRCDLQDAVEVFFNSLEYLSVPRTLADHVTVLYRALLAREPEAGGMAWWVDELAAQLAAIEDDVMASPEFEARVYRLFP
jgi:uncharacterized delta-60 repeat protein